jgi:hypothetical protein
MSSSRTTALPWAAAAALFAAAPPAGADPEELTTVKAELAATQQELAATRGTLEEVLRRLTELEARDAGAGVAASDTGAPRIPPVNIDNPAISFVVDTTLTGQGNDPGWDFALQSGELFLSAPIDPFLRGFATLNGSSEEGFGLEEAALVTTALPWNLTVKGGRFFADFGRFAHWHEEALPFVDRPPSIERFIGESQAEGVEVAWLAPIEHYVRVTTGMYNAIGAERREELMDEGFDGRRSLSEMTFLVHPTTYFDLSDTLNLELGGTLAMVPQDNERQLWGVDVTLRHQPGTSRFYQGFVLGSEWLWNFEKFRDLEVGEDPDTGEPLFGNRRFSRHGGYAYLEGYFGRSYRLGVRGDYSQAIAGPPDDLYAWSAFATWFPSEFQRLRLQGDLLRGDDGNDQRITLQWTAFLGSHAHGFATR